MLFHKILLKIKTFRYTPIPEYISYQISRRNILYENRIYCIVYQNCKMTNILIQLIFLMTFKHFKNTTSYLLEKSMVSKFCRSTRKFLHWVSQRCELSWLKGRMQNSGTVGILYSDSTILFVGVSKSHLF